MSDLALPPEAVEAAVGAYRELHLDRVQWTDEQIVETVGRRLLDAMGVKVEKRGPDKNRDKDRRYRLSPSRWFPVENNTSKEAAQ